MPKKVTRFWLQWILGMMIEKILKEKYCGSSEKGVHNTEMESIVLGEDLIRHIFGICLVNDWSARDIQAWEYQPLGPFLAKSFATSLSPWVVTMEALAPFRTAAFTRAEGDPAPLPYLFDQSDQEQGGLDLWLEVSLLSVRMREAGFAPVVLGRSNFRDMYWTMAQMLTHHASNGCPLRKVGGGQTGGGCVVELTSRGKDGLRCREEREEISRKMETKSSWGFVKRGFRRIGGGVLPGGGARFHDLTICCRTGADKVRRLADH